MGYRLKRHPLSKDEGGKHSKMKCAEKSLPMAFRFCLKFTPNLCNSASVNWNETSIKWIGTSDVKLTKTSVKPIEEDSNFNRFSLVVYTCDILEIQCSFYKGFPYPYVWMKILGAGTASRGILFLHKLH